MSKAVAALIGPLRPPACDTKPQLRPLDDPLTTCICAPCMHSQQVLHPSQACLKHAPPLHPAAGPLLSSCEQQCSPRCCCWWPARAQFTQASPAVPPSAGATAMVRVPCWAGECPRRQGRQLVFFGGKRVGQHLGTQTARGAYIRILGFTRLHHSCTRS